MISTNNVRIRVVGNVAGDPQIIASGGTRFQVSAYDGKSKTTLYVTCFGRDTLASILKKGSAVIVDGLLALEADGKYSNVPTYNSRPSLTIVSADVTFAPRPFDSRESTPIQEEEIPFCRESTPIQEEEIPF